MQTKIQFLLVLTLAVALLAAPIAAAHADGYSYTLPTLPVASDGAVSTNADWEAGRSSKWYVELQRYAAPYMDAGIHKEDPALISKSLLILHWAFQKQQPDGSFASDASTPGTSDPFHSTTFFTEAAARALWQLKAYHPVTYTLAPGTYDDAITTGTQHVHDAAQWLTTAKAQAKGLPGNLPFTHRRWMLAAALAEAGQLSGDSTLIEAALPFAKDGLAMQLTSGWRGALLPAVSGLVPPAVLVAPGEALPAGTAKVINAEGVNPERGGYDVSYQAVGLLMAERYYPLCSDPDTQAQVKTMLQKGLEWEGQFVHTNGVVRFTGSSRIGLEFDRSGRQKATDLGTVREAFAQGAILTTDAALSVPAVRIAQQDAVISQAVVADSGAVNGNAAFEAGTSPDWAIAQQAAGTTFVETGIAREDEDLIRQGEKILDWGWAHQSADGSFGDTQSPTWGSVLFLEAAARAVLDLQNYHPTTYTGHDAQYAAVAARYASSLHATALWLMQFPTAPRLHKTAALSSSRLWTIAAALSEAAQVTNDDSLSVFAATYAAEATSLQTAEGISPEHGAADINAQALSLLAAARYAATLPVGAAQVSTLGALKAGLNWEAGFVGTDGAITGAAHALTGTIGQALQAGCAALNGDPALQVAATRLASHGSE